MSIGIFALQRSTSILDNCPYLCVHLLIFLVITITLRGNVLHNNSETIQYRCCQNSSNKGRWDLWNCMESCRLIAVLLRTVRLFLCTACCVFDTEQLIFVRKRWGGCAGGALRGLIYFSPAQTSLQGCSFPAPCCYCLRTSQEHGDSKYRLNTHCQ